MTATTDDPIELIENFDRLPGAALVAPKIAAAILGVNERTLRRHPPFPRIQLSPRRFAYRVGDIRAIGRGTATSTA
jgi:hypothetical protein